MNIRIRIEGNKFVAYSHIDGKTIQCKGNTQLEALGNLVYRHHEVFGVDDIIRMGECEFKDITQPLNAFRGLLHKGGSNEG